MKPSTKLNHTQPPRMEAITAAATPRSPDGTRPPEILGAATGTVGALADLHHMLDTRGARVPVAESDAMKHVLSDAALFARSTATILITGQSGTGKELLAQFVHERSARREFPYVRVNCAALPEGLIESELFGHRRGAFTGAIENRVGRIAAAADGTLLLDEISEVPLAIQAKLLRVLEEQEFQPVGSNELMRVSARIIATSNRHLEDEVLRGRFREDLYYRLNVLQLQVPALRYRTEDIQFLVHHFLEVFKSEGHPPISGISPRAMITLKQHSWPGNVRQLRNVVHRACVVCQTGTVDLCDLRPLEESRERDDEADFSTMRLEEVERCLILSRLRRYNGNKTATARDLGITSRTLANKMKRYQTLGLVAREAG